MQDKRPTTNDHQLTLMTFAAAISISTCAYLWHQNDRLTEQNQQLTQQLQTTTIRLEQTERTLLMSR